MTEIKLLSSCETDYNSDRQIRVCLPRGAPCGKAYGAPRDF